ncbi:Histidine kinase [Brevibacterium sandarakinum]|uniref:histidine kinase n=1 Tax=Brevibacterium sandarakinum TaxID=629680 RepID=A0A1H1XCM6_BRESA|nr:histidine kinase [Brevibacterium sandarakinum]SDT06446.1 Histidine kinase [Brevibacterium sandarakinum]
MKSPPERVVTRLPDIVTRSGMTDVAVGLTLCVIGLLAEPPIPLLTGQYIGYVLVVIGAALAVGFRRRVPRTALTVLAVLLLVHLVVFDVPSVVAGLACLVAAYTTQTQLVPPWRWGFLAATYAGGVAAMLDSTVLSDDWQTRAFAVASVSVAISLAATLGMLRRQRRTRYDLAVERAAVLEGQLDTERHLAAFEERHRVAREMHDILGHSLNAIAAQAEGARYILTSDTERVDRALQDIAHLSRTAVDDVRDVIDVLRTESEDASPRPDPTLRDLSELITTLQSPGTTIKLQVDGDVDTVPSRVSLAAYRIAQESLTNAITHGRLSPITVRLGIDADSVDMTVVNPAASPAADGERRGHGLIGMAERAQAYGGAFTAGRDAATGVWRVHVRLPWSWS